MTRTELTQYLADFLRISAFKDYAPNGLQVEGKADIRTIVTGVTACQALIDEAIRLKADAILVHHGFFWKSEPEVIIGMKQRRIKALLAHDINLFGYHLPLDAHPMLGNNAVLGRKLGIIDAEAVEDVAQGLVWRGKLDLPVTASEFAATLDEVLGRAPLHIGVLLILLQCRLAKMQGKDFLYLGYQIDANRKMSYKRLYRPYQILTPQGWEYSQVC